MSDSRLQLRTNFGVTTRLGLGLATVMREPSTGRRQDLLRAAYDIGFRHFDVAPMYGLGLAEAELGVFLGSHPDATVATKFGRSPSARQRAASGIQAPFRAVIRRMPAVGSLARALAGPPVVEPRMDIEALKVSAERSAGRLRRPLLDALLLHEIDWSPSASDLFGEAREAQSLPARALGVAASHRQLSAIPRPDLDLLGVVQTYGFPFSLESTNSATQIVYGLLSIARSAAWRSMDRSFACFVAHVRRTTKLDEFSALACVLVHAVLQTNPAAIVLLGSTNASHLASIWNGVQGATDLEVEPHPTAAAMLVKFAQGAA